jgi:hypothetical protein
MVRKGEANKVKKHLFLIAALLIMVRAAYAAEKPDFTLSGYLKNEIGIRLQDLNGDLQKFKNIAELAGQVTFSDDLVFFAKAKYWYDAAYDFRDKLDIAQHYGGHVQRTDWLRDFYLDYTNGPWFLRLGKQQVAWGQADGIAVLDRVNPVDISEYWLQDMQDTRIPLWMFNINFAPTITSNLQFLLIPDFEQSTSATIGAPFCTYAYTRYDNWKKTAGNVNENLYYPGKKFKNSTFALQWSDRLAGVDYTLNYLNGFYTSARNTTIYVSPGNWQVDRAFKRYQMVGGSLNKSFTEPGLMQGFTLRSDAAVYKDEPTYVGDPIIASAKRIQRWNNVFWLIGADKYVFTKWLISAQFAQYILEHSKEKSIAALTPQQQYPMNAYTYGFADQVENIFSLKISTNFMNDRIKPEILWSATDDNQGRISPKVAFEIKDNLWLTAGIHYFYGHLSDSNGQYREQSQFYTQIKHSF